MTPVSFIICSHRAPPSLEATLTSIAAQGELAAAETILVNNGFSCRRAGELLARYQAAGLNLRIVDEPRPGQGFARRAGFGAAAGRFLVLLDDDNALAGDFLRILLEITGDAKLGAVVGCVEPVWQRPPPPWLVGFGRKCLSYNAAGSFRPQYTPGQYWPAGQVEMSIRPPGGGMIIHRDVAEHYLQTVCDEARIGLSRGPNSLLACEDADIFAGVIHLQMAARYDPRLLIHHHISAQRMRLKYLMRLNLAMCYSYGLLYGYSKPAAIFSMRMEAKRMIKNGGGCVKQTLCGRMAPAQLLLELAREIGWSAGRWRFAKRQQGAGGNPPSLSAGGKDHPLHQAGGQFGRVSNDSVHGLADQANRQILGAEIDRRSAVE
jgi:glucosyl-dolichyl phosphate glucuronosyltransferase